MLHQLQYSSALLLCQFLYPYLQHQPPAHSDPEEAPTPAVTPRSLLAGTPEDRVLRWVPRESSPFAHLLGTRAKGSGGAREGEREEGTGKGAGPGGRRGAEARQGLSVSRGLIGGWPDESELGARPSPLAPARAARSAPPRSRFVPGDHPVQGGNLQAWAGREAGWELKILTISSVFRFQPCLYFHF